MSGDNSDRNVGCLGVLTFACIYYCELKNRISREVIFANGKFLKILSLYISAPKQK